MQLEKIKNNAPKVPELVMRAILKAIEGGQIKLNEDLLPERPPAAALGVGRGSLRECLAILEFLGIIENRGNRKVVVKNPDYIQKAISFIRLSEQENTVAAFLEFRNTIEVAIAELACDRATPEDMTSMKELVDRMERDPADSEADWDFHLALAEASHNVMFAATLNLVNSMIVDLRIRYYAKPDYHQKTLDSHRDIFLAVTARDKKVAKAAMKQHLLNIENFSLQENQNLEESD